MKEPESLDEYLKLTDEQKMELMLQERERRSVLWPAKAGKPGAFKVTLWESWNIANKRPAAVDPQVEQETNRSQR